MSKYFSMLTVTYPMLASNNAGETEGNIQTLQTVRTTNGERTAISGYSARYGIRASMQDVGADMWRKVTDEGYRYGDNNSPSMLAGGVPEGKADGAFGYMMAMSNEKKKKDDEGGDEQKVRKMPSAILVSTALSTTPFKHDRAFILGMKEDGTLNPFGRERHYTRYQYLITINIKDAARKGLDFDAFFRALRGYRVGGSHAANATEFLPEVIAWRFHDTSGSGLYLVPTVNIPPEAEVDLTPLEKRAKNLNFTYEVAGQGLDKTVDEGLTEILDTIKSILNDR